MYIIVHRSYRQKIQLYQLKSNTIEIFSKVFVHSERFFFCKAHPLPLPDLNNWSSGESFSNAEGLRKEPPILSHKVNCIKGKFMHSITITILTVNGFCIIF